MIEKPIPQKRRLIASRIANLKQNLYLTSLPSETWYCIKASELLNCYSTLSKCLNYKFTIGRNSKIFEKASEKKLTAAEATLWNLLKDKQLDGRKFRRQHSVRNYVLDFYCPSERLAIELDGEHHFTPLGLLYDEQRTADLNALGIRVLRFENEEVFQSPEAVLAEIKRHFRKR